MIFLPSTIDKPGLRFRRSLYHAGKVRRQKRKIQQLKLFSFITLARVAELVDALDLKSSFQ